MPVRFSTKRDVKVRSPVDTVGCRQDKLVRDEDAGAEPGVVNEDGGVKGQDWTSSGIIFTSFERVFPKRLKRKKEKKQEGRVHVKD